MTEAKYTSAPRAPAEPPPTYETAAQPTAAIAPPPSRLPLPLHLPLIDFLRAKRVILASASPRRRQLLAQVVLPPHTLGLELIILLRLVSPSLKSNRPLYPKTSQSRSPLSNMFSKPPPKKPCTSTPPN